MCAAAATRCWWNLATILVVGVVFCLLVSAMWPAPDAREVLLRRNLRAMRTAIEVFRVQHIGTYPASRTRTSQEFHDQMLRPSNRAGETVPTPRPGYRLGPYFVGRLPSNPISGAREVWIVVEPLPMPPDEAVRVWVNGRLHRPGWIYSPRTGRVQANSKGETANGVPWHEL